MNNNFILKKSSKFKTDYLNVRYLIKADQKNVTIASLLALYMVYNNNVHKTYKEAADYLDKLYGLKFDINTNLKGEYLNVDFACSFICAKYLEDENYLSAVLDEFTTYILNPLTKDNGFDQEIFDVRKYELEQRIKASYDEKTSYAYEKFFEIFGQDTPLAINATGYLNDLEKITKEDLYAFYQELIQQTPIVCGLVDEVDYLTILNKLQANFKTSNEDFKISLYHIKDNDKVEIEKQQIVQSKLLLGFNANEVLNKEDYHKVVVFNSLYGMGANSFLFKIVREKENLCYTIRSSYDLYSNSVVVMAGIEKVNYEKTRDLVVQLLEKVQAGDFSEEELADAKTVVIDIFNKTKDSQGGLVQYSLNRELVGFVNDIDQDIELIKQVSKEDVLKVANTFNLNTVYMLSGEKNE